MSLDKGALKGAKVNSLILETNAYYDIADFNGFTPYLTAGVGVARNKLKGVSSSTSTTTTSSVSDSGKIRAGYKLVNNELSTPGQSETKINILSSTTTDGKSLKKTGFAWNVGLGAMYNISSEFGVDLAYRYRDLGKVKINDTDSKKLKSHNVTVGVVYKF